MTDQTMPQDRAGRTALTRHRERAREDRADLLAVLDEALVCHVGLIRGDHPVVLPTTFGVDPDGPDEGGTVYLHGSVATPWLVQAPQTSVCATFTLLDGAVLARSAFNHSMNYRSAVVFGRPRVVTDEAEREHALWLVVDHVVPDRSKTLRAMTRKELAATTVLALPLAEASVKARSGGPADEPEDVATGTWAGVIPLGLTSGAVEPDPQTSAPVPDDVRRRAAGWAPSPR